MKEALAMAAHFSTAPTKGLAFTKKALRASYANTLTEQLKLEGQMIVRNPQWNLDHRRLLHRMDLAAGTVEIDGVKRTLRDTRFPTIGDLPYFISLAPYGYYWFRLQPPLSAEPLYGIEASPL